MVLHGLPVLGLIREHLCGPTWELRARRAEEVRFEPEGSGEDVGEVDPSNCEDESRELRCWNVGE